MAGDSLYNETLRTHVLFMETTFDLRTLPGIPPLLRK